MLLSVVAFAYDVKIDGIYYNLDEENKTATVTYDGDYYDDNGAGYTQSEIVIPEKVSYNGNEYIVTKIGDYAFLGCTGFTSVTIPNSVTEIGCYAFYGCTGLTSIEIPNGVNKIDGGAFFGCTGLTSVVWNAVACNIDYPAQIFCFTEYADDGGEFNEQINSFTFGDSVKYIPAWLCSNIINLTSIEIPNSVTAIGPAAFYGCKGLTSVVIPNSVTTIGEYLFWYCEGLKSVTIPNNVTSIGSSAFSDCTSLTSIVIPNGVTSIGSSAFSGCKGLTSIVIPNGVTAISSYVFYGCKGLKSVTIPNNVTSIGSSAFSGCTGLTSIVIPNGVTSIGSSAFSDCTRLTSITITDSVKEIGNRVFERCIGLTSIEIPNSVTKIGDYAFSSCIGLISITIPDSVKEIGNNAFERCIALTSIEIPNSVIKIGDYAFSECTELVSVTIENGETEIGYYAFEGTPWFNNQPDGCVYIGKSLCAYKGEMSQGTHIKVKEGTIEICGGVFQGCTGLASIEIPNSVTSIGNSAFEGCSSLTSVTIPNSVTEIGGLAFCLCTELMSIEVDKDNQSYTSVDGVLYDKNKTTLICCPGGKTSVEIPNDVTNIGYAAFAGCTGLTTITIPNGVTLIDIYTFYGCTGLTSIEIPNSVTSIGPLAFYGCTGLTSIVIPNSVTRLDYQAFVGCIGLTSVTIGKGVYISDIEQLLNDCTGLMSINVVDKDNKYCAVDGVLYDKNITTLIRCPRGKTSVEIPNSVTEIGYRAFYGCTGLTSIEISNNVTTIGERAFSGCTGLTSIEIPNSVTEIGNYAFSGCTGLTSIDVDKDNPVYASVDGVLYNKNITNLICWPAGKPFVEIPNSVTKIEDYAFYGCIGLTSIEIPNSVTEIGNYAFSGCTGLTTIEIPNNVTTIGESVFDGCTGLMSIDVDKDNPAYASVDGVLYNKNITTLIRCPEGKALIEIPNSVTSIGYEAFYGCTGLTSIEIPNSVIEIGNRVFYGCTGLTRFEIPNSVTSIGDYAFQSCSSLKSITIPNSVTSIGFSVFEDCTELISIEFKAKNPLIIDQRPLYRVSRLIQIKVPCGSKAIYQCTKVWNEFVNYEEVTEATLTVNVNDETMGFATIINQNSCTDDAAQVQAQALSGYKFVRWSDGATENPHILLVTEDVTITAEFAPIGTETFVENLDGSTINIYSNNGVLYVDGLSADYQVFDINGRLIYTGRDAQLSLPRGVYVIVVSGEVEKVVL